MSQSLKIHCAGYVDPQAQIVSPGFLTVRDGVIHSLKPFDDKPDLDLPDMLVLPGFVNAHCHLELTDLGPLPPQPFTTWVEQLIQTQMATPNYSVKSAIQNGITSLLQSGVTTIIDHFSPYTPLDAYPSCPDVNIVGIAEVLGTQLDMGLRHLQMQLQKQSDAVPTRASPHSVYGLHPEIFQNLLSASPSHSLHISESDDEREFFATQSGPLAAFVDKRQGVHNNAGASPVATVQKAGLKLQNSLIVHGNDLSDTDLKTLKAWGHNCVVHCPGSFEYFRYKNFPLKKILSYKIPIAIGTDSLASNSSLNFLHEIQLFLKMFPDLEWKDLWPMLTTNAADTLQLAGIGKIAQGFSADLIGFHNPQKRAPIQILKERHSVDLAISRGLIRISPKN